MENSYIENTEQSEETFGVKDQVDIILRDLDIDPLPGRVIGTLCQLRRYIDQLEGELQFLSSDDRWVLQNALIESQKQQIEELQSRLSEYDLN